MPEYLVTYKITHTRLFNVPNKDYIEKVLTNDNNCEILSIVEQDEHIDNTIKTEIEDVYVDLRNRKSIV